MPQDACVAPRESELSIITAENAHSAHRELEPLREQTLSDEVTISSCSYKRSCNNVELLEAFDQCFQGAHLEAQAPREVLRPSISKTHSGRHVKPSNKGVNVFKETSQRVNKKAISKGTAGNLELSNKKLGFGSRLTELANTDNKNGANSNLDETSLHESITVDQTFEDDEKG